MSFPFLVLVCLSLAACSEPDSTSDSPPRAEAGMILASGDSVEVIDDCSVSGYLPLGTRCIEVSVKCSGLPAATAELRISPSQPGVNPSGTVLLGGGGTGRSFFAGSDPAVDESPASILQELTRAGYTVIERRWRDGWFGEGSEGLGIAAPSCRYATLLYWINRQEHSTGALCALGNSGGASEVAYSLTRWNSEELLDAAVLGGGPPMSRLDLGCLGAQVDQTWPQTCAETWQNTQSSCDPPAPVCTLWEREGSFGHLAIDAAFASTDQPSACSTADASFADLFLRDSLLVPEADLDYPETHLHFMFGQRDCTAAVALGQLYADAVTSAKTIEYVSGAPHFVPDNLGGAASIVAAIKEYCVE